MSDKSQAIDSASPGAALDDAPFTVEYAAETENLEWNAQTKLHLKNLDMIAANQVDKKLGIDCDENALTIFWKTGREKLPLAPKNKLARSLIKLIALQYNEKNSNKILKNMNRKHTREEYLSIIQNLEKAKPDIRFSSDFIVGYPDESDKDFEDTMKFVDEVKFVIAYSFMYSQRPGTPAQKKDNIPLAEKKARLSALQSLLKNQQKNYNNSFIEKNMEILFEKKGRYKNQYIGRSIYNQSVFINSEKNLINKVENVNIVRSTNFALESVFWALLIIH